MSPFLLIAAAAGALWVFARRKKKDEPSRGLLPPSKVPADAPLPPLPDPDLSPDGVDFSPAWEGYDLQAEFYPPGADYQRAVRPPAPDGISMDSECSVIAIGPKWWDRVGDFVQHRRMAGVDDPIELMLDVMRHYADTCGNAQTKAARLLRDEVADRINLSVEQNGIPAGFSAGGITGRSTTGAVVVEPLKAMRNRGGFPAWGIFSAVGDRKQVGSSRNTIPFQLSDRWGDVQSQDLRFRNRKRFLGGLRGAPKRRVFRR